MYWSKFFIPTLKEDPIGTEAVSHRLLLRAGLVHMLTSGVYSYLPLGLKVLRRIERIIREEMEAVGARELFLPCLHPLELWKKTGRDQVLADVMIKFQDGRGRSMCLGPTHEEVITDLVKDFVKSYRQLPVVLYQIQTKFRDELRTRFGIVRACEFIMKDAYSFDRDKEGLKKNYQLMFEAYKKIFARCGLDTLILEADSGAMGGDVSHEFMVPASIGEDHVLLCPSCGFHSGLHGPKEEDGLCPQCRKATLTKQVAIELGHIFQLGTKYSLAQEAYFLDEDGQKKPMIMGCYGIGVSRVIAAIIEKSHDEKGIIWPRQVTPFDIEILPLHASGQDEEIVTLASRYHDELTQAGFDVLVDDREDTPGRKFNDADLIGIPLRVIIGRKNLVNGKVEIKNRQTQEVILVDKHEVIKTLSSFL
ncbi:MAG TPA: proline--tRNA ligase [Candidatus Omnitrophica bacterium]|nr:MAG: proline--tRNA ligase [Omnitrophica WOR_2 bacterium GWA2_45_18]OGX19604.1 MAG: proline--tRNA ligase [Omnitrophica WOR_2 bacterium GWC2_45_7]HBR15198.1 proline--tRNA ligase [Candidatus Omnitrophota bacterium]